MTTRGSTGWVLLLLALAVPAYMAYNKVSHLKNDQKRELEVRVKHRIPDGAMFPGGSGSEKLKNPITGGVAAPLTAALAIPTTAPAVPPATPLPKPQAAAPAPVLAAPAPVLEAPRSSAPAVSAPAMATQAQLPVAEASSSTGSILTLRDPTLSPYDIYQIQQKDLENRLRREEVQTAIVKPRRRREPPIENTIVLQGIVATPDEGNKAIVNGEMVSQGDMVGKVKILKISAQEVTFLYKRRKFKKSVSR